MPQPKAGSREAFPPLSEKKTGLPAAEREKYNLKVLLAGASASNRVLSL